VMLTIALRSKCCVALLRGGLLIMITLLLTACGILDPVKLPTVSRYTIANIKPVSIPSRSKTRLTLLVSLPIASPGYQSSRMVYVDIPYKLKTYANNRWVASPAEMLMSLLARQLRSKGYFYAVVTPPFSGVGNYRLDTRLLVLQQEFLRPTSVVRLVMQASLVNNTTNRVLASKRFQVLVNAPENNPYSGVLATNKAANILSKRIARFVTQSVS